MKTDQTRVYFPHSHKSFNTVIEKKEYDFLHNLYSMIICPYRHFKGVSMGSKLYRKIAMWSDFIVIAEFEGYISLGVFMEVQYALHYNIPIKVIRPLGKSFQLYDLEAVQRTQNLDYINKHSTVTIK